MCGKLDGVDVVKRGWIRLVGFCGLKTKQEFIVTAKDGKTTKAYRFVLKYPETVVPPTSVNPNESWMDNASEKELKEYAEDMVASQTIEEQKDNLPY